MNQADQRKLLNAGFTIVRPDNQPQIRMKYKDPKFVNHDYRTLENFPSLAARDRKLKELLEDPLIIMD